ncbi:tetratricopeptide repeat protein [Pseudaeromonas paramecii]|uniref:Tetratricopeptide repeat protein n=1 Tax=Pseudaeromonas paramecii TaxID=2138166 RepID=A0ABP8QHJ2_9GAMM
MTLSDTHFTDNELFHLAIAAARQQQHEDTLRHLKTLLARNPEHAEAHYLLGTAYATLGMMEEAAQSLTLALAQAPQLALARFQLGLVRLGLGQPEQASQTLQPLTTQAAEPVLQAFALGVLAIQAGDGAAAEQHLRHGIHLNTANPALNQDMQGLLEALEKMQLTDGKRPSEEEGLQVENAYLLGAYRQ